MDGCPLTIALPLDQVLQAVVTHSAIQYSFDLILFLTVDKSWECRLSARDWIGMRNGQLDHRKGWVEAAEVGGESKAVCAMADTGFNDKGA
jgi:hypothetical protein